MPQPAWSDEQDTSTDHILDDLLQRSTEENEGQWNGRGESSRR